MSQALRTDLYQLTMMQAYFTSKHNPYATFDYFVRKIPFGAYLVTAGLPYVLSYIRELRFTSEQIDYLEELNLFSKDFLGYLEDFRFSGDITGMPEGELAFPQEPILRVEAPIMEAQLIESSVLNRMNFSTLIATKASRVVHAAQGRPVLEFGLRRAQGGADLEATRASFIGGCAATSNVDAAKMFGIDPRGTMAHSFVTSFDSELEAFRAWVKPEKFRDKAIFLIDTYDTVQGAKNAIIAARELENMGYRLLGVRLDSGDLTSLSKKVRKILDGAGLNYVKIFVSSDLNEWKIRDLLEAGSPIESPGVGTEMVTARPEPALGGVYKLVEIRDEKGNSVPKMKLSDETAKSTLPGRKTVWRFFNPYGLMERDVIALTGERLDSTRAREILVPLVKDGKVVYQEPSLVEVRDLVRENLSLLPEEYLALDDAPAYPVELSPGLENLSRELTQKLTVRK